MASTGTGGSIGSGASLRARILTATLMLRGARIQWLLSRKRFDPNQPRVPRGHRFGGRWVAEGDSYGPPTAGSGGTGGRPRVIPASHEDDGPPRLPRQPPAGGRQRHSIARTILAYLIRADSRVRLALLIGQYGWLAYETTRDILAYFDDPKPLEELRDAASNPKTGYDIHHIVERTSARRDGFPDTWIESRENRVLIPRFRHWEITGWYAARREDFGGLSPREYLRGKSWEERMRVGLRALAEHGVLEQ